MKIVFTGGGSGGHFYPLIAIAEAVMDVVRERRLLEPQLYYFAPTVFDEKSLFENGITYVHVPAGKLRRYRSARNFTDSFITAAGVLAALVLLFRIYPDVIVSKGGYGSVPTVFAAWLLGIPIIIHESDAKPGRANLFAARFAKKIAIAFDSAAEYFPPAAKKKIARTGIPIRKALTRVEPQGAHQFLHLEEGIPTVLIIGGSQGSERINEAILSALPELIAMANIIHQTGQANIQEVEAVAHVTIGKNEHASRYHPFNYLSETALQRAAGAANVVVSRAGANSIAEIGMWKRPAILIPIPESVSHDQRMNAYAFARTGAAVIIEEENLSPHLLVSEIHHIIANPAVAEKMAGSAADFTDPDAARILANEALTIALKHEL